MLKTDAFCKILKQCSENVSNDKRHHLEKTMAKPSRGELKQMTQVHVFSIRAFIQPFGQVVAAFIGCHVLTRACPTLRTFDG